MVLIEGAILSGEPAYKTRATIVTKAGDPVPRAYVMETIEGTWFSMDLESGWCSIENPTRWHAIERLRLHLALG